MAEIKFGTIEDIKPGTIVRHFKGNYYYIESIVMDSENIDNPNKDMVLYRALYQKKWRPNAQVKDGMELDGYAVFSRPFDMFTEEINRPEFNYSGMRFAPIILPPGIADSICKVIVDECSVTGNVISPALDKLMVLLQTLESTVKSADDDVVIVFSNIITDMVRKTMR